MQGEPGELKHLSTRRKRKQIVIPKVVASEIGVAQTSPIMELGYGLQYVSGWIVELTWKGRTKKVKFL